MDEQAAAKVITTGTRDVAGHLAEYLKLAESGAVIDIVDQRGRDRRHRAYIVGALPDVAESEAVTV